MKVEIIKCRCGAIIAGCHHSAIDESWIYKKDEYLQRGYTTEIITESFQFGECTCEEGWNTIMKTFVRECENDMLTATDLIVWLEKNYEKPNKK